MKQVKFMVATIAVLCLVACSKEKDEPQIENVNELTIDFEDVTLDSTGVLSINGNFTSNNVKFHQELVASEYGDYSNGGFVCSNHTDMQTVGYANQYSVYANAGANGSKQFAELYYSAWGAANGYFEFEKEFAIEQLQICNATYTYYALKDGNDGFGATHACKEGDWFKVHFVGYNNNNVTDSIDFYLADFRDGKSYICDHWTTVDLSKLGTITRVVMSLDGTDQGEYGLNTPTYVCIDNIVAKEK